MIWVSKSRGLWEKKKSTRESKANGSMNAALTDWIRSAVFFFFLINVQFEKYSIHMLKINQRNSLGCSDYPRVSYSTPKPFPGAAYVGEGQQNKLVHFISSDIDRRYKQHLVWEISFDETF